MHTILLLAAILSRTPVAPPQYQNLDTNRASEVEYRRAVDDRKYKLQRLSYASDGIEVFAYLYAPAEPAPKMPCVIFNRGGFVRDQFVSETLVTFHQLAQAGFVVIAPMYRQSGGAGGRDEVGGADLADLMQIINVARDLEFVDLTRLFMYGESRGGMMTYQAIRDGFPIRAAAVFGAFTDFAALVDGTPRLLPVVLQLWPDYAEKRIEISSRRSALAWADKLDKPLLIMHGGNDRTVAPAQPLTLAMRLEELGKPYELVIRAGANHVLTQWRAERDALAIEWFQRHMK